MISFGVWVFAVIGCVLVALFNVVCVCALFAYFRAGFFGFWVYLMMVACVVWYLLVIC